MTYTVLRAGPPDVMAALDPGDGPEPSTYYFRMSPMFETSVGIGDRLAEGPIYSIFEAL
jgi:hypothetical protein